MRIEISVTASTLHEATELATKRISAFLGYDIHEVVLERATPSLISMAGEPQTWSCDFVRDLELEMEMAQ